jgi:hypothetical protein
MKFSEYRKNKEVNAFPWSGAFSERRDKSMDCFPWSATFAELRGVSIPDVNESIAYDKDFHDHPDVKPGNLSPTHKEAIANYTSMGSGDPDSGHGSSKNLNGYLFNRMGFKSRKVEGGHTPENVKSSVENLSSAFTPENTNRKELTTYSAIPSDMGSLLEKSEKGKVHTFPGFTSTSSRFGIARNFAQAYHDDMGRPKGRVDHIVEYKLHPKTGLSVVKHSDFPENEVLLNHGSKVEYSHTEDKDFGGIPTKIHHVIVHPKQLPLSDYPTYSEIKKN